MPPSLCPSLSGFPHARMILLISHCPPDRPCASNSSRKEESHRGWEVAAAAALLRERQRMRMPPFSAPSRQPKASTSASERSLSEISWWRLWHAIFIWCRGAAVAAAGELCLRRARQLDHDDEHNFVAARHRAKGKGQRRLIRFGEGRVYLEGGSRLCPSRQAQVPANRVQARARAQERAQAADRCLRHERAVGKGKGTLHIILLLLLHYLTVQCVAAQQTRPGFSYPGTEREAAY